MCIDTASEDEIMSPHGLNHKELTLETDNLLLVGSLHIRRVSGDHNTDHECRLRDRVVIAIIIEI